MSDDNNPATVIPKPEDDPIEPYERPQVVDYGTLSELTLSGLNPQTDSMLGAGS